MSKKDGSNHRARYTLEFKLEAVRLVKAGQEASVTARVLGVPKQTLSNWVRLADKGALQGAGERPVSAEQRRMASRGKRKFVVTTDSKHSLPVAENLLARDTARLRPLRSAAVVCQHWRGWQILRRHRTMW